MPPYAGRPRYGYPSKQPAPRKGKVQLIDVSGFWQKMRKSLGSKRKELSPEHIEDITRLFGEFKKCTRDGAHISRIFKNEDFGYLSIANNLQLGIDLAQRARRVKNIEVAIEGDLVPHLGFLVVNPSIGRMGQHLALEICVHILAQRYILRIAQAGI